MESQRSSCLVAAGGTERGVAAAEAMLGTCQLGVKDCRYLLQLRRGNDCLLSLGCQMQAGFCSKTP